MDGAYNNIDNYSQKRKINILTVFDDTIADIMTNQKFQAIIKELFIRFRKLNISLIISLKYIIIFITQSYFSVLKKSQIKLYTLLNNENS